MIGLVVLVQGATLLLVIAILHAQRTLSRRLSHIEDTLDRIVEHLGLEPTEHNLDQIRQLLRSGRFAEAVGTDTSPAPT